MERKLSDKERFIIQVAVNRSAENHFDRQKGWKRVKRCTNNGYIIRRRHSWLAICVSALCLLSGSGYLFIRHFAVYPPAISPSPEIYKADGIPVLTLENGEQIFLNPNQSPLIRPQTAANLQLDSIVQSIRYLPTETPGYDSTLSYHSLEIPKGGEYRLQLADGSRIWLNSESSLRYPVKFGLHRREIFLSGEIYLEVVPDTQRPFIVHTANRTIKVLGTRFNVRNYPTDSLWSTTLVEGKIQIGHNDTTYILKPGEQYTASRQEGRPQISSVNPALYTSWISGKIIFHNERLEEIIRQLQRWYDFEVFYTDPQLKGLHFGGAINKYNSFQVVLKYLERTADLHFDIQGRTVIVRGKPHSRYHLNF